MAPLCWSFAAAVKARPLWLAKRTSGYSSFPKIPRRLDSGRVTYSSGAPVPAVSTRTKCWELPGASRQLCWGEHKHQRKESQLCCCSREELQQRQQERNFLPVTRNVRVATSNPCGGLCPPQESDSTRRRFYCSGTPCLKTASISFRPQSAATFLHNAVNDRRQQETCQAGGLDAGHEAATGSINTAAQQKLANIMLLRRRSGGVSAGECLKALEVADGDIEAAALHLRKQGLSKAASRRAAHFREGLVAIGMAEDPEKPGDTAMERGPRTSYTLVALTSETDFVAANARFVALAQEVARTAAHEALCDHAANSSITDTRQKTFRISTFTLDTGSGRTCSVPADADASSLEAIRAAPVSESLLTLEPTKSADTPRPAGLTSSSAFDATPPQRGNASALVDTSSTTAHGSRGDTKTISVSTALAMLSQQFGEDVRLFDTKSLIVEKEVQRPDQAEHDGERCSSSTRRNTAVGVYVHGQVASGVGRAAALVCLRWQRNISGLTSHEAARAEQPAIEVRNKIERLAQLLCMQVVATQPRYIKLPDISASERCAERQIFAAAAANSAKKRIHEGRVGTSRGNAAADDDCRFSLAADAAPESRSSRADTIVEARLEETLREQTLLEQEFLPFSRFCAEILAFDRVKDCSLGNQMDRDNNSNMPRVGASAGVTRGKSTAGSQPTKSRLTVREALKQAAAALHCSTIEVESVHFLAVGQT